ncbi:hypothetical protein KR044_004581, partial [Drosophila immigrans]
LFADGYWTILETVPYSIASATTSHNHTLSTTQSLSSGNATSLLSGATVVVELPPDDLGNPVGNIQYTIPALTKNATTNTNTTSLHKPQATTIQIVKQQTHHQHHQQQHQQHQQHQHQQQQHHQQQQQQHQRQQISLQQCLDVRQQQPQVQTRQEYIKIDTSRLEDKMLLRDVMQYGATSISMAPSNASDVVTTTVVTAHESELLLADADEAERELELAVIKNDQHEDLLADDEDYVDKLPCGEEQTQQTEKLYVNGLSGVHTTMTLHQVNDLAIDDAKYACNVCGKTYKIKGSLKRHKNYECGVEPTLKCPHCPHKCKYKSDLRKHMNQKHSESGETLLLSN